MFLLSSVRCVLLMIIDRAASGPHSQLNGCKSQHASLKFPDLHSAEQKVRQTQRVAVVLFGHSCALVCMSRGLCAYAQHLWFCVDFLRDLCFRSWRAVKTRPSWRNELEKCKN